MEITKFRLLELTLAYTGLISTAGRFMGHVVGRASALHGTAALRQQI
jgi:hypothetical protein